MNFLAHAHLSFNHPQILVGNMISDFVKGKKQYEYDAAIHKGIQLHRAIDNFTDTHVATQNIKLFFRPQYRLYSGAFTDVVYDHFLANDTSEFLTNDDLNQSVTLSLDFSKEFNNKSYNIDDCRQLIEYLNKITTITFYDSYSVKRIVEYFKLHPFKEYVRKVELIFDEVHLINANFIIKNGDSLVIMIIK